MDGNSTYNNNISCHLRAGVDGGVCNYGCMFLLMLTAGVFRVSLKAFSFPQAVCYPQGIGCSLDPDKIGY